MPQFPRTEEEIIELGKKFVMGLNMSGMNFASMPVSKAEFDALLEKYQSESFEIKQIEIQKTIKIADKNKTLEKITSGLKRNLRFLELMTNGRDTELQRYGWGARRKRQKLKPPEPPRYLEMVAQGSNYLTLDWKAPSGGGKVRLYKIFRRLGGEEAAQEINAVTSTKIRLLNQPLKVSMEYHIIAVNNAGESQPSNKVKVFLQN